MRRWRRRRSASRPPMIHNTLALSPDEIMRGRVLLGELHAAQSPAEREEVESRLAEHFANLARRHLGEVSDSNEGPLTFGEVE